ncbi:EF-hand domain-containing protein [Candidatus Marinarcus aquaticus]|nr:EF-hand domain-containing protein [Candidatus Marinarcus aquaticus]
MKTQLKIGALLVSLFCIVPFGLSAENMPVRGPMSFEMYDVDKDGFISEKEFYDVRAKRMEQKANMGMPMRNAGNAPDFNAFDKDKDGKISELELLKGQNERMQENRANKGFKGNMQQ